MNRDRHGLTRSRAGTVTAIMVGALLVAASACASDSTTDAGGATGGTVEAGPVGTAPEPTLTPLVVQPGTDVVPVRGSDDRYHLVWEVPLQNAVSLDLTVTGITALGDGEEILSLDAEEAAAAVQPLGEREADPTLAAGQAGFAFLSASFDSLDDVPSVLTHAVTIEAEPFPEPITTTGGPADVDADAVVPVLAAPLGAGSGYVVSDGCCDSLWHIRSVLPIDNGIWFAQRYAVDWMQLDDQSQLSDGDTTDPATYTIYGTDIIAGADGTVVHAVDEYEDQVPGSFPEGLPLTESDGNAVIIDIGDGLYVLYAHMAPGTMRVKVGDTVSRGEVLGQVGNTGNTIGPHLHVHVMDGPSPLASNGRPYVLDAFEVTGRVPSAEAFAASETTGLPLTVDPSDQAGDHTDQLPLDLSVVTFD